MIVNKLTIGFFGVNNYIIHSLNSSKAILIDAGDDPGLILNKINDLNLELVYLINTHGHGDHIAGNTRVMEETGAKLMIHPLDEPYLSDPNLNLSSYLGHQLKSPPPDRLLNEGDIVELDEIKFTVLHTPGHTPGHISLIGDNVAFVGDVIFKESIGRTDFPLSSYPQLIETIKTKIYTLPDDTILYNGHGPQTMVGHEKFFNSFVRG
jgi:glyoxylase-like metal-dependent hydrolase (beta-lactamase superfamily II)